MIEKRRSNGTVEVTFVVSGAAIEDGEIAVLGDFNGWRPGITPMRVEGDVRTATVALAPGRRYAFRYLANDNWFNDDGADGYEINEHGGYNGVIDLTETQ